MNQTTNGVTLIDVAPRDGFQSVRPFIPTERKLVVIRARSKPVTSGWKSVRSSARRRFRRWPISASC
jgi:hypothetical protein